MDIEDINCDSVVIETGRYGKIEVDLINVDVDEVLKEIDTTEIVDSIGEGDILDNIGRDVCLKHFDVEEN